MKYKRPIDSRLYEPKRTEGCNFKPVSQDFPVIFVHKRHWFRAGFAMCHNNELLMPLTITIIFLVFLKFNPMEGLNIHQKYCNMVFSARAPNRMNCGNTGEIFVFNAWPLCFVQSASDGGHSGEVCLDAWWVMSSTEWMKRNRQPAAVLEDSLNFNWTWHVTGTKDSYSTQACVHQQLLSSYIFFSNNFLKDNMNRRRKKLFFLPQLSKLADCAHNASQMSDFALHICFHLFPLWLLKKHLGLPTWWQMEKQPHTRSGRQAPLGGSKHNSNPRDGCRSFVGLLSMNLQCSIQGFPGTWPKKRLSSIALPFVHSQRSWVAINSKEGDSIGFLCGVHKQNFELHNSTKIYVQVFFILVYTSQILPLGYHRPFLNLVTKQQKLYLFKSQALWPWRYRHKAWSRFNYLVAFEKVPSDWSIVGRTFRNHLNHNSRILSPSAGQMLPVLLSMVAQIHLQIHCSSS